MVCGAGGARPERRSPRRAATAAQGAAQDRQEPRRAAREQGAALSDSIYHRSGDVGCGVARLVEMLVGATVDATVGATVDVVTVDVVTVDARRRAERA